MISELKPGERLDDLERNGLMLIQHPGRFCYGVDAVLLSWFAKAYEGERVLDFCTGTGVVPILMTAKTAASHFTGLEIQEEVAKMASRSVVLNHLEDKVSIVCGDLKNTKTLFGKGVFNVVTVNPPYMAGGSGLVGADYSKAVSRHEILCSLEDVIRESANVLVAGGRMYMVHRPYRLGDIICLMKQYKMSPRRLCMVHPKASQEANLVLIEGIRGGNTQIRVEAPLVLFDEDGQESKQIKMIHGRLRKATNIENGRKKVMAGMLYLCATPIGNLEDITFRVLRTLKEVDLIAAEDTRNSQKLLNHFDIHTPMTSYHEYNKYDKAEYLVSLMLDGKNIACITDAGTPGISDPGEVLVQKCYEAGIKVTSLPGPAACITALTMSGLSTRRFAFEAFLPADKKQRAQILEELQDETRTIILYEAPHHLVKTLEELFKTLGSRKVRICRELTKKHETVYADTLDGALAHYRDIEEPRGECVIIIEGADREDLNKQKQQSWEEMTIEEHMALYEDMNRKDAMKQVAKDRGVSKRDIYQALLKSENN